MQFSVKSKKVRYIEGTGIMKLYILSDLPGVLQSRLPQKKWYTAESSRKRVYKLHREGEVRQKMVYLGRRKV